MLARGFCGSSWSLGAPSQWDSSGDWEHRVSWRGCGGVLWAQTLLPSPWGSVCQHCHPMCVPTSKPCWLPTQGKQISRCTLFITAWFWCLKDSFSTWRKPEGAGLSYQEMRMNWLECCLITGSFSLHSAPEPGLRLLMELGQSCCSGKGPAEPCRGRGTC